MAILLCFEKGPETGIPPFNNVMKSLVGLLAGPFVHTEMLIVTPSESTCYSIHVGGVFLKAPLDPAVMSDQNYLFLMLPASDEEEYKIQQTCEACVTCQKRYNTKDMFLACMPFRSPEERSLLQTTHLYCAQSITLILRECLDQDHFLFPVLRSFHSRTVTPSELYRHVYSHCIQVSCKRFKLHVPPPVSKPAQ
jgi:hypothetical protein